MDFREGTVIDFVILNFLKMVNERTNPLREVLCVVYKKVELKRNKIDFKVKQIKHFFSQKTIDKVVVNLHLIVDLNSPLLI